MKRLLMTVGLCFALAAPAHAVFFFFLPLGLLAGNDQKTINEMEQKSDWEGIQNLAQKRMTTDPGNPGWLYLSGYAHQKQGNCTMAVPQYAEAIKRKQGDYPAAQRNMDLCQKELAAKAAPVPVPAAPASVQPVVVPVAAPAAAPSALPEALKSDKSVIDRLRTLKQMRDENLITQDQYDAKQREILQTQ